MISHGMTWICWVMGASRYAVLLMSSLCRKISEHHRGMIIVCVFLATKDSPISDWSDTHKHSACGCVAVGASIVKVACSDDIKIFQN